MKMELNAKKQEFYEEKTAIRRVLRELRAASKKGFTILGVSDWLTVLDCGIKACELLTEASFLEEQKANWESWKNDEALQGYTFEDFLNYCVWNGEYYSEMDVTIEAYEERLKELDEELDDLTVAN